jgi:hypothetical protein
VSPPCQFDSADCSEHLCTPQAQAHRVHKKFKDHTLTALPGVDAEAELAQGPLGTAATAVTHGVVMASAPVVTKFDGQCPEHGRSWEYYDETDVSAACVVCATTRRGHVLTPLPVPVAGAAFRQALPGAIAAGQVTSRLFLFA